MCNAGELTQTLRVKNQLSSSSSALLLNHPLVDCSYYQVQCGNMTEVHGCCTATDIKQTAV